MFRRLPGLLMRLGLELSLPPIPRPSSEQFVFYCGAVHTQLQAAAACLQNSLPVRANCTPVATLHRRSIRLRSAILAVQTPPTQNLNFQTRFHGKKTLLVSHRPSQQTVHTRRSGLQPSYRCQRHVPIRRARNRRECRQAAVPGLMLID